MLGIGHDWNQPYSCESWATTFGLTYSVIDDITNIYGLFGTGYIPHNIVIGGDGEVIYSESGFNQTAIISFINEGYNILNFWQSSSHYRYRSEEILKWFCKPQSTNR